MNFAEQIKDFSSHQASRMIVELLTRVSNERLKEAYHKIYEGEVKAKEVKSELVKA